MEMGAKDMVIERLKRCAQTNQPTVVWISQLSECLAANSQREINGGLLWCGLAEVLVSLLCDSASATSNHPSLWKVIHHFLSSGLLSPLHLLSLLTPKLIPLRHSQPHSFTLFLHLLSRFPFSSSSSQSSPLIPPPAFHSWLIESLDSALQLSSTYHARLLDLGHALLLAFFNIIISLIDCVLVDWDSVVVASYEMVDDQQANQITLTNSSMALQVLARLLDCRTGVFLFRLFHLNMPEQLNMLLHRLHSLETHKLASVSSKNADTLARLSTNVQRALKYRYHFGGIHISRMLIGIGSHKSQFCCNINQGTSGCWVYFDIYMENVIDGKQLPVTSAIDILKETIITLHVFNQASWQETFLALWLSGLRLVQRERDPLEGPVPHLEARLSVLLSIIPLAIAQVLEDKDEPLSPSPEHRIFNSRKTGYGDSMDDHTSRKQGLISSLQVLEQFISLLSPPASIADAANLAATKAVNIISTANNLKDSSGKSSVTTTRADGNMRHLIVEACIARSLINTCTYFWPGYVSPLATTVSDASSIQTSPWKTFMDGAPLTGSLINALVAVPAPSIAEIEKMYHTALNGSEDEKPVAAKILCGASLCSGWNIQEHVVRFVVRLLRPPTPPTHSGPESHLVACMPMLSAVLLGASSIDTVHILALHGVIPEVAASLIPLCEVFGSLMPTSSHRSNIGDKSSIYMVFSSAFLFLLRLAKFYKPPLDHYMAGRGVIGSDLTIEYLLLLHNCRFMSQNSAAQCMSNVSNMSASTSQEPIYVDSYPKLKAWYCLNKSCTASTLFGLCSGNPINQVADKILNMIYSKKTINGNTFADSSAPSKTRICGPPSAEDTCEIPLLSAWEVLQAIPLVLEAMLTACSHGRLSSRDLTTGLRDLVDFLPASLASVINYFSAEVTRGIWKPVSMNGTDWPSPAANLVSIDAEIKEVLSAAGVNLPRCFSVNLPTMLPLPMAALLSLTITFKLEKSLEYILALAGPALENSASGCPWPCMPIVGSLWAQKIRRWHDFIVVSCSISILRQNREAVTQLLRNCFSSFLGSPSSSAHPLSLDAVSASSVCSLLGSAISSHGYHLSVAPGFLYLHSCRALENVQYVNDVIVGLVFEYAGLLAGRWMTTSHHLKSSQASLALATSKAKEVAALGASLLCVAGGLQQVEKLYLETIPTWLIQRKTVNVQKHHKISNTLSCIMEGFTLAYLLVLCGSHVWSVGVNPTSWALNRRAHILEAHLKFVVGALEGRVSPGCHPITWKVYVSCFLGLIVGLSPAWIQEVDVEILKKLADGLRGWQQYELALSLLERGGPVAITSIIELLNVID